jgi:hypothetical protein
MRKLLTLTLATALFLGSNIYAQDAQPPPLGVNNNFFSEVAYLALPKVV